VTVGEPVHAQPPIRQSSCTGSPSRGALGGPERVVGTSIRCRLAPTGWRGRLPPLGPSGGPPTKGGPSKATSPVQEPAPPTLSIPPPQRWQSNRLLHRCRYFRFLRRKSALRFKLTTEQSVEDVLCEYGFVFHALADRAHCLVGDAQFMCHGPQPFPLSPSSDFPPPLARDPRSFGNCGVSPSPRSLSSVEHSLWIQERNQR
jgi:hypothetical protein